MTYTAGTVPPVNVSPCPACFVHWAYGWGATRGVLAALGLPAPAATAAHLALVWGTEKVMVPALEVAPPATRWGARELAFGGWHHLVYAGVTGAAYQLLDHPCWACPIARVVR